MNPSALRVNIITLVLLAVLGVATFYGTLSTPFLYDDDHAIVNNEYTQDLSPYPDAFRTENWFNRPVLMFTYALNRTYGGLDVTGFHWVNLGLHILVAGLFYLLVAQLVPLLEPERKPWLERLPLWAGLIQLLHPLSVEPVAYLSARSSLLATFFFVLGMLCYVRYYRVEHDEKDAHPLWMVGTLLCFYLGCGTKATVLTLPLIALVFLYVYRPHRFVEKNTVALVLTLMPLVVYFLYRADLFGNPFSLPQDAGSAAMDSGLYFWTQVKAFTFFYLLKFALPINQNFEPDFNLVSGPSDPDVWLSLGIVAAAAVLLWRMRSRVLWLGALWVVITLAPTSTFVPLKQVVSEHRFYLPGIGASLMLAYAFAVTAGRTRMGMALFGSFLLCFFLLSHNRTQDFASDLSIWEDTAAKSPNKALVLNNLATVYFGYQRWDDAERTLTAALNRNPRHVYAAINLGTLYLQQGKYAQSVDLLQQVIDSGHEDAVVYYNLGLALKDLNHPEKSLPYLKKAVEMKPRKAAYRFALGQVYQILKMFDEALLEYRKSLKDDASNYKAHLNMGTIFWDQGHFYFADTAFQRAYEIKKDSTVILSNLASSNMVFHNYSQAIRYLNEWLQLEPDNNTAKQLLTAAQRLEKIPQAKEPANLRSPH